MSAPGLPDVSKEGRWLIVEEKGRGRKVKGVNFWMKKVRKMKVEMERFSNVKHVPAQEGRGPNY